MSGILSCPELCPSGSVQIVGPYVPNPLITTYRRVQVPRKIINECPTFTAPCPPWWIFRAFGYDLFFDSVADVPPTSMIERFEFPSDPGTLCKIEVFWYEYRESNRANKGPGSFTGGPISPRPGAYAGQPLLNTGGGVFSRAVMDIGQGVMISLPPSGRILANILVPDLEAFEAAGNVLPDEEGLPNDAIAMTRVTPAGFVTAGQIGYPSARFTQSVFVNPAAGPATQTFPIPPLVRGATAFVASLGQGANPRVEYLFKPDFPAPLASYEIAPGQPCDCPPPETAEVVRVTSNGYDGIVTLIFALDL